MKGFCPGARLLYQLNLVCPASGATFHLSRFWFARFAPPKIKVLRTLAGAKILVNWKGREDARKAVAQLQGYFANVTQTVTQVVEN
jgi:hypothetical protein